MKPDTRSPEEKACDALYDKAEWAFATGVPLAQALDAVRDGYSSAEFDVRCAAGDFE